MPGKSMTRPQRILGWCYLPLYTFFLPQLLRLAFAAFGLDASPFWLNCAYFSLNALFVLLVFRSFLHQRFFGAGFWNFVQALIVALFACLAGTFAAQILARLIVSGFSLPNDAAVFALFENRRIAFWLFGVVLAPLAEEVLVRGVVFGTLYARSRLLAYGGSALFFSFLHVWQYAPVSSPLQLALCSLCYLPSGLALAWLYCKSDSIWAPIVMHMLINAAALGILPFSF